MQTLKQLEQAAEKCAADLNALKSAIEALKAKEATPVWPMSVEDFPGKPNFYVSHEGGPQAIGSQFGFTNYDYTVFATIEAANSAAAFSQLSRLVHHINGGEVYDGKKNSLWYCVYLCNGLLSDDSASSVIWVPTCLYFKKEADRDRSMIDHAPLWIQYFTGKKA